MKKQNREIGKIAAVSITCKDCGTVFVMGHKEANWYSNMGYPLPKRCPSCRAKRKAGQKEAGKA